MPFEGLGSAVVEAAADNAVRLRAGDTTIAVAALAADLFRVGVFPRAKPPRYDSGAIAKDDWPDAGAEWTGSELRTPEATAHVQLDPLRISFSDASGRRFAADDPGVAIDTGVGRSASRTASARRSGREAASRASVGLRRAHGRPGRDRIPPRGVLSNTPCYVLFFVRFRSCCFDGTRPRQRPQGPAGVLGGR